MSDVQHYFKAWSYHIIPYYILYHPLYYALLYYTHKNWSGWCNVVRWTMPEQCCYQGSTTFVELTMLTSIVRSIVVWCWQRTIVVTMLLEHELAIVGEKSLLNVVNNGCWTWTTVNNGCWQQLLTGCSTTLLNSVQHNIATSCWQHSSSCSFLCVYTIQYKHRRTI